MPGEETPPPDGGACGSEVVKTTVTMAPHIKAVQGQLKAAKVRVLFSTVLMFLIYIYITPLTSLLASMLPYSPCIHTLPLEQHHRISQSELIKLQQMLQKVSACASVLCSCNGVGKNIAMTFTRDIECSTLSPQCTLLPLSTLLVQTASRRHVVLPKIACMPFIPRVVVFFSIATI